MFPGNFKAARRRAKGCVPFALSAVALHVRLAHAESPSPETAKVVVEGARPHPNSAPRARHVSGSMIFRDRLEQPGASAAEALRESPGLQITDLGGFGAPATASIRGATAAQTPIYFGGVRINDEVGGTANLSDIPIAFVERVEVYRSHAPFVADQLGIGGAVFFEPRRPVEHELRLSVMAGSYGRRSAGGAVSVSGEDTGATLAFELGAAENDYSFSSGRGTLFDPSDDGRDRRSNADASTRNLFVHANRRLGPARLSLLYHHADREQGAPKLALTPSESARVAFRRDLFVLGTRIPVDAWAGSIEFVTHGLFAETTLDDPQAELNLQAPKVATSGERVEESAIARQLLPSGIRVAEQISLTTERLRRLEWQRGIREPALVAERLSARAALSAERSVVGPLFVEAALAWSLRSSHAVSFSEKLEHEPSGRLGLDLRTQAIELYTSVGRYQRIPTLSELYGASLLTRGNPELQVESGTTFEAGMRKQFFLDTGRRLLWLDAAGFSRFSEKLVKYARTAQGYMLPVNLSRARALGAELSAGSEPLPFLSLVASLSLLDARDTSANRQTKNDLLPFSSRFILSGLANLQTKIDVGAIDSASFGLRALYTSSRYADFAGIEVIPEQSSLNLEAALDFFAERLKACARVSNLTDARNFDIVGFPLPGRTAYLSMEAKL